MRTYSGRTVSLPRYILSVSACDLSWRKARWNHEAQYGHARLVPTAWSSAGEQASEIGLLVEVGPAGQIERVSRCDDIHGVLKFEGDLLAARHNEIEMRSRHLGLIHSFASHPMFNDLRSIRLSLCGGVLVAASGTDCIIELSSDGSIIWSWWASEHGFCHDSFGVPRDMDRTADHRRIVYDSWLHSTHINSVVSIGEEHVLASLFHQGMICIVNKGTGTIHPMVEGLRRPHGLRWNEDLLTFADTASGTVIAGRVDGRSFVPEIRTPAPTRWLQDVRLIGQTWMMVDGESSRVLFVDLSGRIIAVDAFDPDWVLYETELIDL
jgi:hypothetical protein